MTIAFPYSSTSKAFDGLVLLSVDGSAIVWAFPGASVQLSDTDNISRPDVIDASELSHVEIPGVRMGSLSFAAYLMPDRSFDTFLTAGFGPRTSQQLTPFIYNILPYNGGAVIKGTGVWFSRVTLSAAYGTSGQQAANMIRLSAMVMDIDNFYSAATLAAPAAAGTNGAGISSFDNSTFNNGSTTTYDKVRSYSYTLDNQLSVIPTPGNAANRLSSGCQPGPLRGAMTLEQLQNPTNALPGVKGQYPLSFNLPTGNGAHALTIGTNLSRDGSNLSLVPADFIGRGQLYSVFYTGTASPTWPFTASYA